MSTNVVLERPGEDNAPVLMVGGRPSSGPQIALSRVQPPPKAQVSIPRQRLARAPLPIRQTRPPPIHEDESETDSDPGIDEETLNAFSNQEKRKPDDEIESDGSVSSSESSDDDPDPEDAPDDPYHFEQPPAPVQSPYHVSAKNPADERFELMFKLSQLKGQGVPGIRAFGPQASIHDIRAEFHRVKTVVDVQNSIDFQGQTLLFFVLCIEKINSFYDPLSLQLDGFTAFMHGDIRRYNNVFEALYFKHKDRIAFSPELQLVFMVFTSAIMFHVSKTIFGPPQLPQQTGKTQQQQQQQPPNLMNLMSMMTSAFQPQQPQKPTAAYPYPASQPDPPAPRGMAGPGIDLGAMLGALGGFAGNPVPMPNQGPPMPVSARRAEAFHDVPAYTAPQQKRPRSPSIASDDSSERYSDVVTESLKSVPEEDLSSIAHTEASEDIRSIRITNRRARAPNKNTKNVVKI